MSDERKLTVMVSSSVYGSEELLDLVYARLVSFGYEVWMSHKGTLPVSSKRSAYENCMEGVRNCDLFLGIITKSYGRGIRSDGKSITHKELLMAIELNRPRWLLSHSEVVFARSFLADLGFVGREGRKRLALKKGASSLDALKVIDMYEDAAMKTEDAEKVRGNWVQKFEFDPDALLFLDSQFSRYQEVEEIVKENFEDQAGLRDRVFSSEGKQ